MALSVFDAYPQRMRSAVGIGFVLLIMVAMYVALGTFFRDKGARRPPVNEPSDDSPPGWVKFAAGSNSVTARSSASRAWYRYETRSPTRFWGTGAFLFLWGAFLTAAAGHYPAAIIQVGIGLALLLYAFVRWRGGNRWTPTVTAPPLPPPPLPMPSPEAEDVSDEFVVVRGDDRHRRRSRSAE